MASGDIRTGAPIGFDQHKHDRQAKRDGFKRELLITPNILERGVSTLIGKFGQHDHPGDPIIQTPATFIELSDGEGSEKVEVIAATKYADVENFRKAIFQRNGDGQLVEWVVFSGLGDRLTITDGSGKLLDTETDRQAVRTILDAMGKNYERSVVEKANNFDVNQFVTKSLETTISDAGAKLVELRQLLEDVKKLEAPIDTFKVHIRSAWASEGEKNLDETMVATTLAEAIQEAVRAFKKMNKRSDVQGSLSISASIGEKVQIGIPDEVIKPLFDSLGEGDGEEWAIRHAIKDAGV